MPYSTSSPVTVYRARMAARPADLDALLDAMALLEPPPGSWEDVDTGEAWIEAFSVSEPEARALALRMAEIAESIDGVPRAAVVDALAPQDWTESWKRHFHVLHVTDRIVVRPVWEGYDPAPGEIVIAIEPGMSFGTGLHATTQSCIRFLEQLAKTGDLDRGVVDLGCGSGILAIAARKLGFATVGGYDIDPVCVRDSRRNADLNGLDIPFATGDALAPALPVGDIVVANILAPVLLQAAPALARAVSSRDGHALVLSGILASQYADVKTAFEAQGFHERDTHTLGDWQSGLFTHAIP
ncbi:MAG: 50S ribosomal protein L11 methyltransferase [Kiritimatiellia bacterium]|jgi:ribosomal protein L11 methyltransferase